MERRNKKFGFTLAEILITLAVIGVVASMTLPSVIQHYKEQVTIKKLKQTYSILLQAFNMINNENGGYLEYNEYTYDRFKSYLNIAKDCGTQKGCFGSSKVSYLNNNKLSASYDPKNWDEEHKIILNNGVSLMFNIQNKANGNLRWTIIADTDGPKGKNTYGIDLYQFGIPKNGNKLVPAGYINDPISSFRTCNKNGTGVGCAAWIIFNGNMDYLHCDDLSWDGKKTCK